MEVLTVAEVAKLLRTTIDRIYAHIKRGQIRAIDISSGDRRPLYRIERTALEQFVRDRAITSLPKAPLRRRNRRSQ